MHTDHVAPVSPRATRSYPPFPPFTCRSPSHFNLISPADVGQDAADSQQQRPHFSFEGCWRATQKAPLPTIPALLVHTRTALRARAGRTASAASYRRPSNLSADGQLMQTVVRLPLPHSPPADPAGKASAMGWVGELPCGVTSDRAGGAAPRPGAAHAAAKWRSWRRPQYEKAPATGDGSGAASSALPAHWRGWRRWPCFPPPLELPPARVRPLSPALPRPQATSHRRLPSPWRPPPPPSHAPARMGAPSTHTAGLNVTTNGWARANVRPTPWSRRPADAIKMNREPRR